MDETEKKASELYLKYTKGHPTIPFDKFPKWKQLSADTRDYWLQKAKR